MKWVLRFILILNILISAASLAGYLGSYISPQTTPLLQVMGLFMPWLLLLNILFFFFWLTMRKRTAWISLVTLLLGLPQTTRFIGLHFTQESQEEGVLVGTFNCESYNESNNLRNFLQNLTQKDDIDILCLQEISPDQVKVLADGISLPHKYFHKGKIIVSKYPISSQGHIQFDQSVNGCIWADLALDNNYSIRIYNVHLRSNGISHAARGLINEINADRSAALTRLGDMISNYSQASKIRVDQVRKITDHLRQCTKPVILVGDLNDTPFSFSYQQISNILQDQFKQKGLGLGMTYAGDLPGLKIDYIFADEHFRSLNHQILHTKISDHFPVLGELKLNK